MEYRESINVPCVEGNHILLEMIIECRMNACTFCYVTNPLKTINKNENVMAICKIRLP